MNGMNGLMKPAKKKDKKDCVSIQFYKMTLLKIIIFFIIFWLYHNINFFTVIYLLVIWWILSISLLSNMSCLVFELMYAYNNHIIENKVYLNISISS